MEEETDNCMKALEKAKENARAVQGKCAADEENYRLLADRARRRASNLRR